MRILISFYLLLILCMAAGETVAQRAPEYLRHIYTSNDGLPSTRTSSLFQDRQDYLWIGTSMGLSRFDGVNFVNYTDKHGLPGNVIQAMGEDCQGTLYIGTSNGLAKFNGSRFIKIPMSQDSAKTMMVNHFTCRNDTLWISASDGLYFKVGHAIFKFNTGAQALKVIKLSFLKNGAKLLATNRGLLYLHHNTSMMYLPEEYILDMSVDARNNCWIAALSGRTYCWKNGVINKLLDSEQHELGTTRINISGTDIWFARREILSVFHNDVFAYDITGLNDAHNNFITDVLTDRDGNHWISSNDGLIRLRKTSLVKYKTPENTDAAVYSIQSVFADGQLWIGGSKQIFTIGSDSLHTLKVLNPANLVSDISFITETSGKDLLIGQSLGGLNLLKNAQLEKYDTSKGIRTSRMLCHYKDADGSNWIGSNNMLYQVSQEKTNAFKLHDRNILSLLKLQKEEVLLVGTNHGLTIFKHGVFESVQNIPELKNTVISSLATDRSNNIIIGIKGSGILICRFEKNILKVTHTINISNGMESEFVLEIIIDPHDQLWALTGKGLYRIRFYLSAQPLVEYIGREEGMPDNSWSEGAIFADKNGRIFIGGSKGLVSLDCQMPLGNGKNRLKPHFTKIVSGRNGLDLFTDSIFWNRGTNNISINYSDNSFTVHYNCVGLTYPGHLRYSSFLEGYDETWSTSNNVRFVNYNNVPPGRYKLHLKVISQNGNQLGSSTIIFIHIKTPFWMTWWFRFILAGIGLFILFAFFRWRKNQQLKLHQKELETSKQISESRFIAFQARMNPHFIFNSLNAIQYFILNNDKESTLNYLSKFARLLRQVLDNSLDTSISVESELQILRSYVEMESMRFDNKFEYAIETGEGFDPASTEIPGMILQPFVENAIVHGLLNKQGKGHLHIHLYKSGSTIICSIRDDGIGRTRSALQNSKRSPNHRSHGMSIALKRLELLAGETSGEQIIEIKDLDPTSHDTGTEIIIRLPII